MHECIHKWMDGWMDGNADGGGDGDGAFDNDDRGDGHESWSSSPKNSSPKDPEVHERVVFFFVPS